MESYGLSSQEVEDQFYEEYYPHHDIGSSEMGYYNHLVDYDKNSPVDQAFIANFGEGSLDSNDDGMYYSHEALFNDVKKEGYDLSKVFADEDVYEYTPEFREAYGHYLKSRQGPTKEMFGKKFAKIVNYGDDKGAANFIKDFIKNRS